MCHNVLRADTSQLDALLAAIASAAKNGSNYQWIAGVLAGCLAEQTTTTEARAVAIATLTRRPLETARQWVA
jgi:hypothetical protein